MPPEADWGGGFVTCLHVHGVDMKYLNQSCNIVTLKGSGLKRQFPKLASFPGQQHRNLGPFPSESNHSKTFYLAIIKAVQLQATSQNQSSQSLMRELETGPRLGTWPNWSLVSDHCVMNVCHVCTSCMYVRSGEVRSCHVMYVMHVSIFLATYLTIYLCMHGCMYVCIHVCLFLWMWAYM